MAINFPSTPTVNDEHTDGNGVVWVCTSDTVGDVIWVRKTNPTSVASETFATDEAVAMAIALGS